MIELSNSKVEGFEPAIRGMRNPMNSWEMSDSRFEDRCVYHLGQKGCDPGWFDILNNIHPSEEVFDHYDDYPGDTLIGQNDKSLMQKLANAGSDHSKYRRMITVWVDILAPLYWWKGFDTYKVGTVANSCSTMHKIHAKEFTIDDFSHEHLLTRNDNLERGKDLENEWRPENEPTLAAVNAEGVLCYYSPLGFLSMTCDILNRYRELYLQTKDKQYWWQMIQLLPSSYNQKRTVMLNYEVLSNIYHARKDHKLNEWKVFCEWVELLPESWIITEDWRSKANDILKENEELKKKVEELEEKLNMVPDMFKHELIVPVSDGSNEGLNVKIDDIDETQELIDIYRRNKNECSGQN